MVLAYLDTCIISGLAKNDLDKNEQDALLKLLKLYKDSVVGLVTSEITQQELEKIPETVRKPHNVIYFLIKDVPISSIKCVDSGLLLLGVGGSTREDPIYTKIKDIITGDNDRLHVFQAIKNNCTYFVTTDRKTILKHNIRLSAEFKNLNIVTPSELISKIGIN